MYIVHFGAFGPFLNVCPVSLVIKSLFALEIAGSGPICHLDLHFMGAVKQRILSYRFSPCDTVHSKPVPNVALGSLDRAIECCIGWFGSASFMGGGGDRFIHLTGSGSLFWVLCLN